MPPEQKNIGIPNNSSKKTIPLLVGVFVVLLFIILGSTFVSKKDSKPTPEQVSGGNQEKVSVVKTDLKSVTDESQKIPQGLPGYIPVETKDAYESYIMNYEERNVTQYSVSYLTATSPSIKYKEYLDVMTKNGFIFSRDGKNESQGFLYGTKDNDDLTIVISKSGSKTSVQISFLDRR